MSEKQLYFRNSKVKDQNVIQLVYFTLFKVAYRTVISFPAMFTAAAAESSVSCNESISPAHLEWQHIKKPKRQQQKNNQTTRNKIKIDNLAIHVPYLYFGWIQDIPFCLDHYAFMAAMPLTPAAVVNDHYFHKSQL